jgi:hypothetical protein
LAPVADQPVDALASVFWIAASAQAFCAPLLRFGCLHSKTRGLDVQLWELSELTFLTDLFRHGCTGVGLD